jgi:hypothetical protein
MEQYLSRIPKFLVRAEAEVYHIGLAIMSG